MSIQQKPTMLETTAIQAAQTLAINLLGVTDHAELDVLSVYKSLPDRDGVRQLEVWLQLGKKIAVKLAKRLTRNPEGDNRWYAISAWVLNAPKSNCLIFSYSRPEDVSEMKVTRIVAAKKSSLKRAKRQRAVIILRAKRKDKYSAKPQKSIEELIDS